MKDKKIKIDKQFLWMLFLFIPYIKLPDYIVGSFINNFMDLWKICSFSILLFTLLKKNKLSPICLIFILFEAVMLLSTMRNSDYSKMWTQFVQLLSIVGVVLYSDYYINIDCEKYFSVVSKYICFLSFINSITMFIYYPTGMYVDSRMDSNYYFLQLDNISFFTVYIGLICLMIHSYLKYNRVTLNVYLFYIFTFISYFYVNSTTAYACMALLLLGVVLIDKKIFKLNYWVCIVVISLFCLGITYFHIQDYFKYIIVDILHKGLDFTNRRWIWDRTIKYIIANPIFGYGLEAGRIMELKIGFNHIHNIFLEIIYKGGIIAIVIYYIMMFINGKRISVLRNSKYYNLLCLFLLLYLFICQFDYYNDIYVGFIIYIIIYNAPTILKKIKGGNDDENISNNSSV